MPRKTRLLPYLRETKSGRLEYVRRVPPELQKYLGNRRYLTQVLPVEETSVRSKAVIRAWTTVNGQIEAELSAARAQLEAELKEEQLKAPLTPRDAAGIAAEPWRKLRDAGDQGQITTDIEDMVAEVVLIASQAMAQAGQPGSLEQLEAAKAAITQRMVGETLKQLQIQPDAKAMRQIQQRLLGYVPMFGADERRREAGDFSPGDIETKAPPLPTAKVTFETLVKEWLAEAGGIREIDGVGVGQKRIGVYERAITELIQATERHYPSEIGIEQARAYLKHIQEKDCAVTTKQRYLSVIKQLYSLGVRLGYLDANPFSEMKITIPKGTRSSGYRPFTQEELIAIFSDLKKIKGNERSIVPLLLLMTGARLSDVMYLRHSDVKQSDKGVWYFDMVDCPQDQYPRTLKGGEGDERHTPLHPLLIERGFLDCLSPKKQGYIFQSRDNGLMSAWFQRILIRLGIYEKQVTGLHSLRGNAIDAWRDARLPEDVRRALTAHSSRDVQDKSYGEGLRFMPDVLFKELSKVDWSWLP